ncbi:hypothetical protein NQ318_012773 [Aromia moschata]|uniref:Siah interacting protein N-terminal domain-containing protein n=1 Tax=Aromia moschata TaxID=1265417 RepID=A0AAV8YHF2_9CUCU|nr:hypothetical protein NQ318_012773 [Aromia moschata]
MANKIEELKMDIAELEVLEKQAVRQKNKDVLSIEIRKLLSELARLEEQTRTNREGPTVSSGTSQTSLNKRSEYHLALP